MAAEGLTDTSHVYVARREPDGLHKVGYSDNPDVRVKSLGPAAWRVRLGHVIASTDPFAVEQAIHAAFYDSRVEGEWFRLSDGDLADLVAMTECHSVAHLPPRLRALSEAHAGLPVLAPGPSRPRTTEGRLVRIDAGVLPPLKPPPRLQQDAVIGFLPAAGAGLNRKPISR